MGRSKTKPVKRQRIEEDMIKEETKAIAWLRSAPQAQVELAAADATRMDLELNWSRLICNDESVSNIHERGDKGSSGLSSSVKSKQSSMTTIPSWALGLGSSQTLDPKHFAALQALHESIKAKSPQWTSWSGSPEDPRKRAFGFLLGTLGYDPKTRQQLDITMPWRKDTSQSSTAEGEVEERNRNDRAIVVLEELPEGAQAAIIYVCDLFRKFLPRGGCGKERLGTNDESEKYQLETFLQYQNLIAAQPNLHNGRGLFPMHLDHPRKDGFGVVIVTICVVGAGQILLQDFQGDQRLVMPLQVGQAYMLSDRARDACVHGVLADVGHEHRESLNLRFGLHDLDFSLLGAQNSDGGKEFQRLPCVPSSHVLKHWEETSTYR